MVQERRAYVPQGWSKFYEFSFADLRSGADIINQACDGSADPQWSQLHGLLERAIYGGRVDSAYDIIVLRTYLRQFFSNEMTGGGGVRVKTLPGTDISLPNANDHGTFTALLRRLDEANSPSLFSPPGQRGTDGAGDQQQARHHIAEDDGVSRRDVQGVRPERLVRVARTAFAGLGIG